MKKTNFKIPLILIIAVTVAFAGVACGKGKTIEGFTLYDNDSLKFKLQYPSEWTCVDESFNIDEIGSDPTSIAVIWYDFENTVEEFTPYVNLSVRDAGGLTQKDLKSTDNLSEYQQAVESVFPQMYSDFKPAGDMRGNQLGSNYFAVYGFDAVLDGLKLSYYQAITVQNDSLYTFTFVTHTEKQGDSVEVYDKMLSSLDFKK